MSADQSYRVLFVIPTQVHLLDICGPAHLFYEAKQFDPSINLHFVGLNSQKEEITSAGLFFSRLEALDSFKLSKNDIVFIPGLEAELIFDEKFNQTNQPFFKWLVEQHCNGAKICSVCTGAYLLAQSGLLNDKSCTTHWKYLEDFRNRFPKADLKQDRLFVKTGNIYTSAGVSSGIDLALFVIEEHHGSIFAAKIAKEIVIYLRRTEDDPQLSVFLMYRNHLENRIHKTQDYLAQHLDKKMKIEQLAELVHMSPRNLTRQFKKTTGITIGEYVDKLRVEKAIQLLLDGQKVDAVSLSCGLASSNQLRSLLKKYKGVLPNTLS
ncbi:helix-turn-helix domain-containing protein [Ekhidna sp.]|uniref:GlxA family transcriptional regulator n=1 Tax=Ekhidna sp. TaxID=2608089 RepID=UPI00329A2524